MKKYKLIKWYPSLPRQWEVGDIVEFSGGMYPYQVNNKRGFVVQEEVEQYPEFWKKVKEKNYEILEVIGNNTGNIYIYNGVKNIGNGILNFSIYSVKRLSDGEVFTVGDYIASTKGFEAKIEKFKIANNFVYVYGKGMGNPTTIMQIRHKEREPIFTTEDGVDIYEDDKFWLVSPNYKIYFSHGGNRLPCWADIKFSTEEKAKEYVDLHKPQYSKKDIIKVANNTTINCKHHIDYEDFFKELNKLNN